MKASALIHVSPGQVMWRDIVLPHLGEGLVRVKTDYSAISAGTESMIFQGRFPKDMPLDDTLTAMSGTFEYPFAYGYSLVGTVVETGAEVSHEWLGRRVFLFHPHQDLLVVPVEACLPIPVGVSQRSALFSPNMETALSFVMDAAPLVGENVIVFGQGVVGLLTAAVLSRFPLGRLITLDPLEFRRAKSIAWCSADARDPNAGEALLEADLCFELTGNIDALNQAIAATGFAGRILIGSWYGATGRPVDLGGAFHRRRISLISSQVSTLNPALTGRWNKNRRMDLVWRWLEMLAPDSLITHEFHPAKCQDAFELCSSRGDAVLQVIFCY